MKNALAILCLLFAVLVYGQKSTLLQNYNPRAKELKHSLNKTEDTLILKGKQMINKVGIFNKDFEKTITVNNRNVKIPLQDIPVGRFVTEVRVEGKLIIITLLRHEAFNKPKIVLNEEVEKPSITDEIVTETTIKISGITSSNGKSKVENVNTKKYFWIVQNINNGHKSRKFMRFGDKKIVNKMIEQNKLDLKTKSGKLNELIIWEVYDTSKFTIYKKTNPDCKNTLESDFFNTTPYYNTLRDTEGL